MTIITESNNNLFLISYHKANARGKRLVIKHRSHPPPEFWEKKGKEKRRKRKTLNKLGAVPTPRESRRVRRKRNTHEQRSKGGSKTAPTREHTHKPHEEFDSTLGYPGEGPLPKVKLKVATLNVAGLNDTTNKKMGGLFRWANEINLDIYASDRSIMGAKINLLLGRTWRIGLASA